MVAITIEKPIIKINLEGKGNLRQLTVKITVIVKMKKKVTRIGRTSLPMQMTQTLMTKLNLVL